MVEPTSIQIQLEPRVRSELAKAGYGELQLRRGELEVPFYNPGDPELELELVVDDIHVRLHADGAHFTVGPIQDGFERASFTTDQGFVEAFLRAFRQALDAAAT